MLAEELTDGVIDLQGRELAIVEVGHSDMDDTTCLYAPSIGLVVAGDVVYNDVYLQLRESDAKTRLEWIATLDTLQSMHPTRWLQDTSERVVTTIQRTSPRHNST